MIIVTGATGQLGRQIVHQLLERMPADEIGVSVRNPDSAADLAARGVRVRHGDFSEPQTLDAAFEGASQVLIVSLNSLGEPAVTQTKAAIDVAYRAGAGRVLYTSHQAAAAESLFAPARDHAAVEAYLADGGRPYTSLRNGYYVESLKYHLGGAVQTGQLVAPADGPVSWTARADLAVAAATILATDGGFEGPTPPLTAGATVELADVAAVLTEATGRPVERVVVDDEDWVASMVGHGTPEFVARMFLGSFQAARRGEFAVTGPTLATLLGREPQSVPAVAGMLAGK